MFRRMPMAGDALSHGENTMSDPFIPRVGGILSTDIAVPEHNREVGFYSRVLTTGAKPLWREDLMNNRGMPVIGLGERIPEYEGLPLQWMPHIQVEDVAASAARALELGGKEIMHGKDESGASLWAAFFDPSGAAFGIMPVVKPEQMPKPDSAASDDPEAAVGSIAWVDLTVADASALRDFYCEVVGWSAEEVGMGDPSDRYADYNMICGDGKPAAGICHARGVNVGVPPVWMHYLPVGDLAESVRRVEAEGGEVVKATRGADGELEVAVIKDPVGVCIALAAC